jgi:DNA polymerase-3 subunit epsilon
MQEDMEKLIALDIETTGLYPEQGHGILEIGAVPIVNGHILPDARFESLVNPHMSIPPEVVAIHGITDEMVRDAPSLKEIMPAFLRFIDDSPLVAHNATFDIGFLNFHLKGLGVLPLKNRTIDTLELSKQIFFRHRRHNLDALLKRLGISYERGTRHRSISDAILTARAYLMLRGMGPVSH